MIELRLFRYFVAVAETLHFTRAAELLGIAQPPLSQQIKKLECDLNVQLFRRSKRKVELTEAGEVFLEHARATLRAAEQAVEQARRAAAGKEGRLAIGMVSSVTYEDLVSAAAADQAIAYRRDSHRFHTATDPGPSGCARDCQARAAAGGLADSPSIGQAQTDPNSGAGHRAVGNLAI